MAATTHFKSSRFFVSPCIISYVNIRSCFVVIFQVANFLLNTLYTFSITWIKQGWTKLWENTKHWKQQKSYLWRTDYSIQQRTAWRLHFNNKKSLFNANFASAVLLERTRGFITTPRWGNVQEISGNCVGPRDRGSSRLWILLAKCCGAIRVCYW